MAAERCATIAHQMPLRVLHMGNKNRAFDLRPLVRNYLFCGLLDVQRTLGSARRSVRCVTPPLGPLTAGR